MNTRLLAEQSTAKTNLQPQSQPTTPQSVRDALADAETLILGWWANPEAPFVHEPLVASDHGMRVAHSIAMGWGDEGSICFHARSAARAAFRAVPDLREARP